MAGNSIVFDIAEEIPSSPSSQRAGGDLFWVVFSRFSGTKLKHTSNSLPPSAFSLSFPVREFSMSFPNQVILVKSADTLSRKDALESRASRDGRMIHRTMRVTSSQGALFTLPDPPPGPGWRCIETYGMKHAHTHTFIGLSYLTSEERDRERGVKRRARIARLIA